MDWAWVGAWALAALAGALELGRRLLANRREDSRERTRAALAGELARAGLRARDVERIVRATDDSPRSDRSTIE